jgi:hypothetical protein
MRNLGAGYSDGAAAPSGNGKDDAAPPLAKQLTRKPHERRGIPNLAPGRFCDGRSRAATLTCHHLAHLNKFLA